MKLPSGIERELREVECYLDSQPGQKAGPSRLRGLRSAFEAEVKDIKEWDRKREECFQRVVEQRNEFLKQTKELEALFQQRTRELEELKQQMQESVK